ALGVLTAKGTARACATIAVAGAASILAMHTIGGAPGGVWTAGVPYLLADGHNLLVVAIAVALLAGAAVALYSIAANGDDVRIANVRNGETVKPDWITHFGAAKVASIPLFL